MSRWSPQPDSDRDEQVQAPHLTWIIWLAAITAAAVAGWTVLSYRPLPDEIAAKRDESDGAARRVATATGGGERNIRRRLSNGEPQRALEDAVLWAQSDRESIEAVYWASYLHARHGEASESRRLARRGMEMARAWIDRDPTEPRWSAFEGWFHLLQSDRADAASARLSARDSFDRAASLLASRSGTILDASIEYDMACYLSMAGRLDDAAEHLALAVELGWTRTNWLRIDPDLDPLRAHPSYASVMVRLEEIRAISEASHVEAPTFSDLRAAERDGREGAARRPMTERLSQ